MLTLKNLSLTASDAQGRTDIVKNVSLDVELEAIRSFADTLVVPFFNASNFFFTSVAVTRSTRTTLPRWC